jgi:bacteriocin biosynthesis cyclodehydratase domain-containing protein
MRPRLRRSVDLRLAEDGTVVLLRGPEQGDVLLDGDGPALSALLACADGNSNIDQLAARAGAGRNEVSAVVRELAREGLVDDASVYANALGPAAANRFDRQLDVFADQLGCAAAAAEAQRRLSAATVCLLGLGGLGSWVAWGLVSAGVGRLVGVDGDVVEASNLNRQILYRFDDVGRAKAEAAGDALRRFAPEIAYRGVTCKLAGQANVEAAIEDADIVVSTVDHPAHVIEHWVQAAAFARGIPLLVLSQHPPLVRVGPLFVPGRTGCLLCQEREWRKTHALFGLVERSRQVRGASATFGPACGVAGTLAAAEVIALLTGTHTPATLGAEQLVHMGTYRSEQRLVPRHDSCPRCGSAGAG